MGWTSSKTKELSALKFKIPKQPEMEEGDHVVYINKVPSLTKNSPNSIAGLLEQKVTKVGQLYTLENTRK